VSATWLSKHSVAGDVATPSTQEHSPDGEVRS